MCKGVRLTSSGCHVTSSHHRWGYPSCAHFNAQVPGRSTELLQIGVTDFHDLGGWPERSTKPAGMGQSWRHSIEITPLWITHSTKTPLSLWKDFFDPKKWSANSHLFSCGGADQGHHCRPATSAGSTDKVQLIEFGHVDRCNLWCSHRSSQQGYQLVKRRYSSGLSPPPWHVFSAAGPSQSAQNWRKRLPDNIVESDDVFMPWCWCRGCYHTSDGMFTTNP